MAWRREFWFGRSGCVLATTGATVDLGGIWKRLHEVRAMVGGVLVLFHLVGLALFESPLMFVEFGCGRRGQLELHAR
jgi:SNF family Na+-dependent transporter